LHFCNVCPSSCFQYKSILASTVRSGSNLKS
jgi:hypothetical protein